MPHGMSTKSGDAQSGIGMRYGRGTGSKEGITGREIDKCEGRPVSSHRVTCNKNKPCPLILKDALTVWTSKTKLYKCRIFQEEGKSIVKVQHLDKLAKVGDRHGNDDQQADGDTIFRRVEFAPSSQDLGKVATLGHPHKLPSIGGHLRLEQREVGYPSAEDDPSPQPRSGDLDGDGGHVTVDPLLLRAIRCAGRHEEGQEVANGRDDEAQKDSAGERRRNIPHFAGEGRGAVVAIEVPEEIVEQTAPEHPAEADEGERSGLQLGIVVEQLLGRLVLRPLQPSCGIDLRDAQCAHDEEGTHGQHGHNDGGVTYDFQPEVVHSSKHDGRAAHDEEAADAVQVLLKVVVGASQHAGHVLQKQYGIDGIVGRAGHPAQISSHETNFLTKGLLDPGDAAARLGVRTAQFGRNGRLRDGPNQRADEESQEGAKVAAGPDGGLDAKGSARYVVEGEDGQGEQARVLRRSHMGM